MYRYRVCSANIPESDFIDMVNSSIEITRRTFMKHVDRIDLGGLEITLGYATHPSRGLTMARDPSVSYHRGSFRGERCYYLEHSGIYYIFIRQSE